ALAHFVAKTKTAWASVVASWTFRLGLGLRLFRSINLTRLEDPLGDGLESLGSELPEETTAVALVAGGAALLADFEQDRISIAIDEHRLHLLRVPAFLPFAPEAVAAAAEIDRLAAGERFGEAFRAHIGQHQDFTRLGILSDGRKQSVALGEIGNVGRLFGHDCLLFGHRSGLVGL